VGHRGLARPHRDWGQLLAARGYAAGIPTFAARSVWPEIIESNRGDWGGGDFKDVMAASTISSIAVS